MKTIHDVRRANFGALVQRWRARGHSVKALAAKMDVGPSYVSQLVTGKSNIGNSTARKIEKCLGLNHGMLDHPKLGAADEQPPPLREPEPDYSPVSFYPDIRANAGAAGHENGPAERNYPLMFRRKSLLAHGANPDRCFVAVARGDSMNPVIDDGDALLISTAHKAVQDSRIYALEVDGGLMVKRLHRRPGGKYLAQSANPAYPAFEICADDSHVEIVGEVLWAGGWL
jgi:transcriptional regulator with XRE-family HTH domain